MKFGQSIEITHVEREGPHGHIVRVWTGTDLTPMDISDVISEVFDRMQANYQFHLHGIHTGTYAGIARYKCQADESCYVYSLREIETDPADDCCLANMSGPPAISN